MRSGSVKALSRGGDVTERRVQRLRRKFHEIRYFSPDQCGTDWTVGIQLYEHRAVLGELARVAFRHIGSLPRRVPVRFEIANQNSVLGDRKPIDSSGDAESVCRQYRSGRRLVLRPCCQVQTTR